MEPFSPLPSTTHCDTFKRLHTQGIKLKVLGEKNGLAATTENILKY